MCSVERPVQTTSEKYMDTWLKTPVEMRAVVRRGNEGDAGAQAGAEDPEAPVALLLKPVQAGARIDDGLPGGVDGAAEVARNVVIGALQFGRHARPVVGQAHAQRRDSETGSAACTEPT